MQQCQVCHCTESNPCLLYDEELQETFSCSWAAPNLCDNPECIAAVERKFGNALLLDV